VSEATETRVKVDYSGVRVPKLQLHLDCCAVGVISGGLHYEE